MFGAAALAAFGLAACSGSSSETVAQIDGVGSISRGTLEHWIPIEARLVYAAVPKRPVPAGAVPSPPSYSACIAFLRTQQRSLEAAGPEPTTAQLKRACAAQYAQLEQTVLDLLITWDWTLGAAAATGVRVTDAETDDRLAEIEKTELAFVSLGKYLKYTGQTLGDMLLRTKVELLQAKQQRALVALVEHASRGLSASQRLAAVAKLESRARTTAQWIALTSCRPGYVSPDCKQYKGSSASSN
jgi:hypothetical protein